MAKITVLDGVILVHLTYLPDTPNASWCIACMPGVENFKASTQYPNYQRTGDTRAVTCLACKTTTIFKQAQDKERRP